MLKTTLKYPGWTFTGITASFVILTGSTLRSSVEYPGGGGGGTFYPILEGDSRYSKRKPPRTRAHISLYTHEWIRRLSVFLNFYCKRENVEGGPRGGGGGGGTAVPRKKCPPWGDNNA